MRLYIHMLSHFSRVWLFATLWTVATRFLCSWDSSVGNTVVGCHFLLQGNLPIHVSCIADGFFVHWATWETQVRFSSVQFSSVTQSCPALCDPMNRSMPGLPVHHQLPEFTKTYSLSWWCHPTISSSVIPFSSCLQSFPMSGSFQMSQFFTSGGQNIGVSASTSVLPMKTQDWSPLGRTGWISLLSKRLSRVFSNTTVQKH